MPSIPLKAGKYSDTGYRFRKNVFQRNRSWYSVIDDQDLETVFYDLQHYNTDTFDVDPDFQFIARMYFRLGSSEMNHQRIEYDLL